MEHRLTFTNGNVGLPVPEDFNDDIKSIASSSQNTEASVPLSSDRKMEEDSGPSATDVFLTTKMPRRFAKRTQRLFKGIRELKITTEQDTFPFPKITVVGLQNTGKTSLIESISGIRVPRSADTCRQCPIEINFNESETAWKCGIVIRSVYDYDGRPAQQRPTRDRHLGPWTARATATDQPFAVIEDKEALADAIYGAQQAVIHPLTDYRIFLPGSTRLAPGSANQVAFSPNVVRLNITGRGLPDLSLFDLPWIVSQHEKPYFVKLVQDLVRSYIAEKHCLIIQTITVDHDPMDCSAATLIEETGATNRAVGVFTTPDHLSEDKVEQFASILQNERSPLGYGYYCVLNGSVDNLTSAAARRQEEAFFRESQLFAGASLRVFQDHFGISRLLDRAGKILFDNSLSFFPDLNTRIQAKAQEIQRKLDELPPPVGANPSAQVQSNIDRLAMVVQDRILGNDDDCSFFKTWFERAKAFWTNIVHSHARVYLQQPLKREADQGGTRFQTINDGDEVMIVAEQATPRKRHGTSVGAPPAKRIKLTSDPDREAEPAMNLARKFDLDELKEICYRRNRSLPGKENMQVTETLHRQATTHWPDLLNSFLDETESTCKEMVLKTMREVFTQWNGTALIHEATKIIEQHLDACFKDYRAFAHMFNTIERCKPFTVNKDAMAATKAALIDLEEKRFQSRVRQALSLDVGEVFTAAVEKRGEELLRGKEDPYQLEIKELATARGYYAYTAAHFADLVARSGINKLFVEIAQGLANALVNGIGINAYNANERCTDLLTTDKVQRLREQYQAEQQQFAEGRATLEELLREDGIDLGKLGATTSGDGKDDGDDEDDG